MAKFDIPGAISNKTKYLGQTWSGMDLESYNASVKFKYNINDNWYSETGYNYHVSDRYTMEQSNALSGNNGQISSSVQNKGAKAPRFILQSWFAKAMGNIQTGSIEHNLGLSTYGYIYESKTNDPGAGNANLGTQQWGNFQRYNKPNNFTKSGGLKKAIYFKTYNATLADDIKLSDQFSFLGALTYTWVNQKSYANKPNNTDPRIQVGNNTDKELTYLAGLTYRPVDNTSIYFTYSNSIQIDGLVPANYDAGRTLVYVKPIKTEQYELGAKTTLGSVDLSTALFQIERPLYYKVSNGVFEKHGKQVNRGLEATAGGKLGNYVSVYGGFMLLDAKLRNTYLEAARDKYVVGVPKFQSNLVVDFAVPNTNKLNFMTNLHYTGKRYVDDANTKSVDGYFTTDLGVRYTSKTWLGKETTFRFNVNNIFDKKYFISVRPGESDGAGTGTTDMYLGDGRNFTASFEVKF
ncbi:TonB-dependent receptor [Campylobacter concisus]|uniref:TonB-dependent receptor n=1 Tax=Campylobacter concisus TaxID=199 RepID=UPI0021565B84|nr:TonB-dependent receptor [Campylobacter concisus]